VISDSILDDIAITHKIIQGTKCQPTGLVYSDVVVSFKQGLHVSPFDPSEKIQYAKVKGSSDDFPLQLISSLQTRNHPAGTYVC
jgi:hypothetical protein